MPVSVCREMLNVSFSIVSTTSPPPATAASTTAAAAAAATSTAAPTAARGSGLVGAGRAVVEGHAQLGDALAA